MVSKFLVSVVSIVFVVSIVSGGWNGVITTTV